MRGQLTAVLRGQKPQWLCHLLQRSYSGFLPIKGGGCEVDLASKELKLIEFLLPFPLNSG